MFEILKNTLDAQRLVQDAAAATGHVIRMNDDRLPKVILYSELKDGTRSRGGQRKGYKDLLKANMKRCDMVNQTASRH